MEITKKVKQRILAAMNENRRNYPSDNKHAASLGVSPAVYSMLKGGQTEKVLSEANWITMARRLGVSLKSGSQWKAAQTPTFKYIWAQLTACQESGLSALLCDMPNIGKTFAARQYVSSHRNAVYVDCSQVKSKRALVKRIAQEFGVGTNGRYADYYEDLVFYLRTVENPLVVLDEAGDLQYDAYLELKALWNATERCCGWYMMGADGLKAKIERNVECAKVGYAEMMSRYGDRFCKVTPDESKAREAFLREQARMVAEANAPEGADIGEIVRKADGALRRVYVELEKLKG